MTHAMSTISGHHIRQKINKELTLYIMKNEPRS